jgi:hypothetical protein
VYASKAVETHACVVALDYGQFSLSGGPSFDGETLQLLGRAQAGSGIASDEYEVLVLSPHQNNFRMPLSVERWDSRPPDDGHAWQEIFESALTVTGGILRYDSPTMEGAAFGVPDGRYAVRISGRNFVSRGWPGSTTPPDEWRVQLWPSADPVTEAKLKTWDPARD